MAVVYPPHVSEALDIKNVEGFAKALQPEHSKKPLQLDWRNRSLETLFERLSEPKLADRWESILVSTKEGYKCSDELFRLIASFQGIKRLEVSPESFRHLILAKCLLRSNLASSKMLESLSVYTTTMGGCDWSLFVTSIKFNESIKLLSLRPENGRQAMLLINSLQDRESSFKTLFLDLILNDFGEKAFLYAASGIAGLLASGKVEENLAMPLTTMKPNPRAQGEKLVYTKLVKRKDCIKSAEVGLGVFMKHPNQILQTQLAVSKVVVRRTLTLTI